MSPRNRVFWGQKVKGQGHGAQKSAGVGLHSCECWLLLVASCIGCCAIDYIVRQLCTLQSTTHIALPFVCLSVRLSVCPTLELY